MLRGRPSHDQPTHAPTARHAAHGDMLLVAAVLTLTLPPLKAVGFQTVPRDTFRGLVQARTDRGIAPTPGAPHLPFPTRFPRHHPKMDAGQFEVLTEKIACMTTAVPPVRLLQRLHHGGAIHLWQLTQPVRQRIKPLILWRFTFYVPNFPAQRPMSSIKELVTVYQFICNLCYTKAPVQHEQSNGG